MEKVTNQPIARSSIFNIPTDPCNLPLAGLPNILTLPFWMEEDAIWLTSACIFMKTYRVFHRN
jgi:hypothetical protein